MGQPPSAVGKSGRAQVILTQLFKTPRRPPARSHLQGIPTVHDKYRKRYRLPSASNRLRNRSPAKPPAACITSLVPRRNSGPRLARIDGLERTLRRQAQAAAVLGHRLRPGDLPSDEEVRDQLLALKLDPNAPSPKPKPSQSPSQKLHSRRSPRPSTVSPSTNCASSRSKPSSKTPSTTPKATRSHSLQVFHLARDTRPYDEEFLLGRIAARRRPGHRHPVPRRRRNRRPARRRHRAHTLADRAPPGPRTPSRTPCAGQRAPFAIPRPPHPRPPQAKIDASENAGDLLLLRELDQAGRVSPASTSTPSTRLSPT